MVTKTISTEKCPQLFYRVYGQGDPVVLLHGFPLDGQIWQNVAAGLSAQYKVIVPDLPGAGMSSFEGDEMSIDEMAGAVKAILDTEHIDRAIVCGHSMGGYVALALADRDIEMIAGLGLIHSSSAADTDEKKEQRWKAIELFRKGGKDPFIRQMVPGLFSPVNKDRLSLQISDLATRSLSTPEKSMIAFYTAMINRPDRSGTLKNGNFPVLWAMGEDDTIMPINTLMQQTSYANVNFVEVIAQCGHMAMIENPSLLISHIMTFAAYCYR